MENNDFLHNMKTRELTLKMYPIIFIFQLQIYVGLNEKLKLKSI